MTTLIFVLLAGLAVGSGIAMVVQRNPLYSAISLIGVFIALAGLYLTLAAPFLAAIQIIVYAGAIMVLVVFVIMLLNVEEEARRPVRRTHLAFIGVLLGAVLIGEALFMLTIGGRTQITPQAASREVGLTASIGTGLFTEYLLPFEITSVLILMALVGAISLARQVKLLGARDFTGIDRSDLAVETGGAGRGGDSILQPGRTEATGQAMAEAQIARGEASAPAEDKRGRG
jgi:NADH-quinone oxidoreductase subunit J